MSLFPTFNYIGSKMRLLDFIKVSIERYTSKSLKDLDGFADPFSGTGVVCFNAIRSGCKKVLTNDIQHYAYVVSSVLSTTGIDINKVKEHIRHINVSNHEITGDDIEYDDLNFICNNYTELSDEQRMYLTVENGYRVDKARQYIEKLYNDQTINIWEYKLLLKLLLYAVTKVSNVASVYGAYLKYYKKCANETLYLDEKLIDKLVISDDIVHASYNMNISDLLSINNLSNYEVVYIDPPYVANRGYDANYHLLETISKYDYPKIKGKTGIRDETTKKSKFCSKREAYDEFRYILSKIESKYIFISYSSESILSKEQMEDILSEHWQNVQVYEREHYRFRSNDNTDPDLTVTEYLFCGTKVLI